MIKSVLGKEFILAETMLKRKILIAVKSKSFQYIPEV